MAKKAAAIVLHPRTAKKRAGPTCVDLFSGAGGLAVGFRQAGWSVLAANDVDAEAGTTFRLNFPEASFFEGPIAKLTSAALLKECGLKAGDLDCLIGGPPCQSFSYNNHQRSAKDVRARLFRDYLRLVGELKPKTLVMENVPGILTIGDRKVVKEIEASLSKLGYKTGVRILDADQFGTPQTRRRVFIVASRMGAAADLFPSPTHRPAVAKRKRQQPAVAGAKATVTVADAISDLPILRNGGGKQTASKSKKKAASGYQRTARSRSKQIHNHICHDLSPAMLKRIKHVPEGGNWRDIPRRLLPAGMRRARPSDHTKRYGRLARRGQASTLLTKCDPHWGAYIHPTQNRTISVREAARLQGFPDAFRFAGEGTTKQYAQVGNAVPVPLARAIAKVTKKHVSKPKRARGRKAKSRAAAAAKRPKSGTRPKRGVRTAVRLKSKKAGQAMKRAKPTAQSKRVKRRASKASAGRQQPNSALRGRKARSQAAPALSRADAR